jgi:hypothetical protein
MSNRSIDPKTPAKVLVADVPDMDDKIRDCLPEHDLTFVRTMVEAVRELRRDGYEVIVIGLHFDESRMFELLSYVRTLPKYDDTPVLCVQGLELHVPEAIRKNIDMAVKALGGKAFLDLRERSLEMREHCGFMDRVATAAGNPLRPN